MNDTNNSLDDFLLHSDSKKVIDTQSTEANLVGPILCALLNCGGGVIRCGVAGRSNSLLIPLDRLEVLKSTLEKNLMHSIKPISLFPVVSFKNDGAGALIIQVPSGQDIPYAYNHNIFVLDEEEATKADVSTIRDLVLTNQLITPRWERQSSLELSEIHLSSKAINELFSSERVPEKVKNSALTITDRLQVLALSQYGRLTNAADVLLAKNPEQRWPQTRVRAVAYRSKSDNDYLDQKQFEGPVTLLIGEVLNFIERNTPSKAIFNEMTSKRINVPLYPREAIREALVNAFAHRDYSRHTGGIKVEISPTKLEIWNSGELPEGVNFQSNKQDGVSILTNPDIANILYIQGYMEKLGRGSVVIKESCKKAGLPQPEWASSPSTGVTLTFNTLTNGANNQLTIPLSTSKLVLVLTEELSSTEIQGKLDLKDNGNMLKHLKKAMKLNLIERTIPEKPTSSKQKYRLTELGKEHQKQSKESS
jgi:ATP-dependent DNA helicase RecG